jgi:predicted Zn finger-like uncharacterized protein
MKRDEPYIVMAVQCPRCSTKQKVHVSARGALGPSYQVVKCIQCGNPVKFSGSGKILRGPFPY